MKTSPMNRRAFLKAMGLGLGATAASSMIPLSAFAEQSGRPHRFLVYYVPHGWPIDLVDNFGVGSSWLDSSYVLKGFSAVQDKVSVLRGASLNTNIGHGGSHRVLNAAGHGKTTVDTVIAKHLNTIPWKAHVCSNDYFARISFDENGNPSQSVGTPLEFIDRVFGNPTANDEITSFENHFRQGLFDLNERQLERLASSVSDLTSENTRLKTHINSVREVKARAKLQNANLASVTDINALRVRQAHTEGIAEFDQLNTATILDGHLDVIASGLTSGAIRVCTLTNHGSGGNYIGNFPNGPNVDGNIHMNSHAGNAERRKNEYAKNLIWYLDRLKGLVDKLNTPDPLDPGRTVLDNTTILYTSEMCDGSHVSVAKHINIAGKSTFTYFPFVMIGGHAGKMKTGGVIETPVGNKDILQTFAHSFGTTYTRGEVLPSMLT